MSLLWSIHIYISISDRIQKENFKDFILIPLSIYIAYSFSVDHSRVKLVPMEHDSSTDYINANYIPVSLLLTIVYTNTEQLDIILVIYIYPAQLMRNAERERKIENVNILLFLCAL